MRRLISVGLVAMFAFLPAPSFAQGVNYHAAQQAGKVWGDKIGENNRRDAARNRAIDRRPITAAERQSALVRHRDRYDRLVDSVGTKNADRFLESWIRQDRRSGIRPAAASPRTARPAAVACSLDSRPAAEQKALEAEFDMRVRRDGMTRAGAWAREQGRLYRERLEAQGVC